VITGILWNGKHKKILLRMGRKKKNIINLSKKSIQIIKSKFRVQEQEIANRNVSKDFFACQATQMIDYSMDDSEMTNSSDFPEVTASCSDAIPESGNTELIVPCSLDLNRLETTLAVVNDLNTTNYVRKLIRENAIKYNLNRTSVSSLLKGLKRVYPLLPSDYRSLLKTPRKTEIRKFAGSEYIHFSLLRTFQFLCKNFPQNRELEASFFVDGVAFFSDCCKKSFWVILCLFEDEIYPVGISNGSKQPTSFNEFLLDLVNDIKILSDGFWVENNFFTLKVKNFCADAPAKAHITYTAHPTAYSSCPYCYIEGFFDRRMIFDTTGHPKRTNDDFINQRDKRHHRGKSLLETELNLNMIDQFPADVLHIVYLGVFKKQLKLMFDSDMRKLQKQCSEEVSKKLLLCNMFMVSEIHRKFRSLNNVASFHGNECRSILLKFGIVVFKGAIPNEYYKNYLLLHTAISILCDKDLCVKENLAADLLLKKFIENSIEVYGNVLATSTLHMLDHLAETVKTQNLPLENFSTFKFENYLFSIRRSIHKNQLPLQQIHRRIIEEFEFDLDHKMTKESKHNFSFIQKQGSYVSVTTNNKIYSTIGCRDRFILSRSFNIYVCMKIEKGMDKSPIFLCRRLKTPRSFFKTPINSSILDIYECDTSYTSYKLERLSWENIRYKLQGIPYSETSMVFVPIKDFESNQINLNN